VPGVTLRTAVGIKVNPVNGKRSRRGLPGLEFAPVGILGLALLVEVGRGDGEGP